MAKTLWKETLKVWLFGLIKIPLVFWLKPRIIELDKDHAVVCMPYVRRTKNHVGSMYFGAIVVGAELAPGLLTLYLFNRQKEKFVFLFKDFQANFLKRCESHTYFICSQGAEIQAAIDKARTTGERQNVALRMIATKALDSQEPPVAEFSITISIKCLTGR
jgi:acyl-coenzyme A thioesterase PaaI-like protein